MAGLFRLVDSVKAFPQIFIMTSGGPGIATEATNYCAYMQGFSYTFILPELLSGQVLHLSLVTASGVTRPGARAGSLCAPSTREPTDTPLARTATSSWRKQV